MSSKGVESFPGPLHTLSSSSIPLPSVPGGLIIHLGSARGESQLDVGSFASGGLSET
jgi:hypothetical protein